MFVILGMIPIGYHIVTASYYLNLFILFTIPRNMMKIYVTDFTIILIPNGGIMSLEAFKYFIIDLIKLGNLKILRTSLDSFQSVQTAQSLERLGIKTELLSVDKLNDPIVKNYFDTKYGTNFSSKTQEQIDRIKS